MLFSPVTIVMQEAGSHTAYNYDFYCQGTYTHPDARSGFISLIHVLFMLGPDEGLLYMKS